MTTPKIANTNGKPSRPTKKAQLVKMLSTKSGADLASLGKSLEWQPHTIRAAISRLRKDGMTVLTSQPAKGGALRYRILQEADPSSERSHGA